MSTHYEVKNGIVPACASQAVAQSVALCPNCLEDDEETLLVPLADGGFICPECCVLHSPKDLIAELSTFLLAYKREAGDYNTLYYEAEALRERLDAVKRAVGA